MAVPEFFVGLFWLCYTKYWCKVQDNTFVLFKELPLSSEVLVHLDPKLEIRLACDVSSRVQ